MAAAGVMLYHYAGQRSIAWHDPRRIFPSMQSIASYGWLGVEFFFVISGFVICMSAWDRSLKGFVLGRVVRLFPAYWFAVLTSAAVLLLLPRSGDPKSRPTASEILTNLTMLEDPLGVPEIDHVYWTLWAEMRFYLIFAVVVWMGLSYRRVLNFSWLWLLAAVLAPQSGLPLLQTVVDPRYAPLFIGGIALYAIRREGPHHAEPWVLLAITWLIEQHTMLSRITTEGVPNRLSWTVAVGILTAIYLTMAAVACGLLDWVNWRALSFAGALSYPLYLTHQEIGLHLLSLGRGRLATAPLVAGVAAAMVALAWLIHRYVERPGSKRLRAILTWNRPNGASSHSRHELASAARPR